ncbi:hypothetical protein RND81_09G049300 [Saponaria officinalis]|uniref:Uncharacterized protein n=1 Tax=Saponaria officinalis TaxID=3572 RepID=A0AAW1IHZ7_SAPOF
MGPSNMVRTWRRYSINGYKFRAFKEGFDVLKATLSNGVCVSSTEGLDYYGTLKEVIELTYYTDERIYKDDKEIKMYVTWSFTRTYGKYFTKWSEASQDQRRKMYTYFTSHVRNVDTRYDPRPEWERRVRRRITALMNAAKDAKKKPNWLPAPWWENVKARETSDPEFAKLSATNKLNRRSGKKDQKAVGTHTLGRKSAIDAFK